MYTTLTVLIGLAHCLKCDLKDNLWLCLTCGSLGCGRQQFGGIDGNGHGLDHYTETRHPVAVKLGTITPEGNAGEQRGSMPVFFALTNLAFRHLLLRLQ
jgi:uncharacterized UBP type Zn finger protein